MLSVVFDPISITLVSTCFELGTDLVSTLVSTCFEPGADDLVSTLVSTIVSSCLELGTDDDDLVSTCLELVVVVVYSITSISVSSS